MRTRYRGDGDRFTVVDVPRTQSILSGIISFQYPTRKPLKQTISTIACLGGVLSEGTDYRWLYSSYYRDNYIDFIPTKNENGVQVMPVSRNLAQLLANAAAKGMTVLTDPASALISREIERMDDVVTPNFRKRVNAGEIINNPMTSVLHYVYNTPRAIKHVEPVQVYRKADGSAPGNFAVFRATVSMNVSGQLAGFTDAMFPGQEVYGTTAELDSIANVYAKLQSAELDVALMAAEGKQTLEYIRELCRRIMRLIELATNPKTLASVAKKTWHRLRRLNKNYVWEAKGIAEAWLEVRYAIRPLMYDIVDSMEYFVNGNKRTGKRTTFRSKVTSQDADTTTTEIGFMKLTLKIDTTVTARAGILADRCLESKWADLGFLNLAGVAWEKVKWSFILDWIINISGLLYRLNPTATWREQAAWVKVVVQTSFSGDLEIDSVDGIVKVPIVGTIRHTHRSPVSGPPLTFISVNLDTFKMLDLIALASNLRGKISTLRL